MPHDLAQRFLRYLQRKDLVRRGDHVVVAVSGGLDSIVLLHLFKEIAPSLQLDVAAAHFDHGMRSGSAEDAAWLAQVCQSWGILLHQSRSDVALRGETAARAARYQFLSDVARRSSANHIATAHHADDQVETVLFRLLRGTGMRGLAGIPVRRGIFIRPLIRFTKDELRQYAALKKLEFREDETNQLDSYARNRIRHKLLPALRVTQPRIMDFVLSLSRHAARSERAQGTVLREVLARVVLPGKKQEIELARGTLLEYDAEIRARVLRTILRRFGVVPDRSATRQLLQFIEHAGSGATHHTVGAVRIERAYDVLRFVRAPGAAADQIAMIPRCADGAAQAVIGGQQWRIEWKTSPEVTSAAERFDCSGLVFPLELRAWRSGDRLRMVYGTKKLKKLFGERRVPFNVRSSVPVLVGADGRVLWVVGVARAEEAQSAAGAPALTIRVTNAEIS